MAKPSDEGMLEAVPRCRPMAPGEPSIFSMNPREFDAWLEKNRTWLVNAHQHLAKKMAAIRTWEKK